MVRRAGGCGALYPVSLSLEGGPPRVFTLQLAWESHSQEPATIGATMQAVGEQVRALQGREGPPTVAWHARRIAAAPRLVP